VIREGRHGEDLTLYEGQVILLDEVMKGVLGELCDGSDGSGGERQGKELRTHFAQEAKDQGGRKMI
jgi:hypothetical protein